MPKTQQIPTKTLQLVGLNIKDQKTFFKFLKKQVFECAIINEAEFTKQGLKNQYIHESVQQRHYREEHSKIIKQKSKQHPLYVISSLQNHAFTLNAYTQKGIKSLDIWLQLLQQNTEINLTNIELQTSQKIHPIKRIENKAENTNYTCTNYIPYRNCVLNNGFYYDADKTPKIVANFEQRLKKNITTFLKSTCAITDFEEDTLWVAITHLKDMGKKVAINTQKKQFFKISFSCNYTLPNTFSLGQNVAYGNGVFTRIIKTPDYATKKTNTKTN